MTIVSSVKVILGESNFMGPVLHATEMYHILMTIAYISGSVSSNLKRHGFSEFNILSSNLKMRQGVPKSL